MRDDLPIIHETDGRAEGLAVGRGGVLPRPEIPITTKDLLGVDLTHIIHIDDVASAKPGTGGGGGGGGGSGGGTTYANYTSGAAGAYNITIEFKGTWTAALHQTFVDAADFYSRLIVGDVADVKVIGGKGAPRVVDDIYISAELTNIDGSGGILGQAGPTSVRTTGSLPATATMQFDIADANDFATLGLFDDIVYHEMGHSLGFGSIWDRLNLVDSSNHFTGATAIADNGGNPIIVEADGGSGTAGSHWDEETYTNELMTGYIDNPNHYSYMSAGSFADLGYHLATNYHTVVDAIVL